jgi:hypothetical protein
VAVARGNEKGRVHQAIRYVRDAFFAARTYADLNGQAEARCKGRLRIDPVPKASTAGFVSAEEAPRLLPLPDNPAPLLEHVAVSGRQDAL